MSQASEHRERSGGVPSIMSLYSGPVLDHGRKPQNCGKLIDCTHQAKADNPMCGDHIAVSMRIAEDRVARATFEAEACAVCRASASMMTTAIIGRSEREAGDLAEAFVAMLSAKEADASAVDLGELRAFAAVRDLPSRKDCAALPWVALIKALKDRDCVGVGHHVSCFTSVKWACPAG
jgi:nitrogen fixation protein NifU and related proteins